ncbi:hypothetical protein G6N82_05925 [Altererythrobacter sp. BO-6]|uniref:hypothetical protein n=1 Tax=Altererythrobacter sp. BO-6 TaxID=2604537 RepID=UPI0013E11202|nr:hypothetical protein [Altererythrobacter sp. BO-6]QIG53751.1 hypothetical protein G6N82_05925 [Altererythrobacter sp. BO-6]
MKIRDFAIVSVAAACLISCGNEVAEVATEKDGAENEAATANTIQTTAAMEAGSGVYGLDCEAETGRYEIILNKSEDGFVSAQVTDDSGRFEDLLTSYSYMGDATPADFLIAIMFDPTNAPVPDAEDPRIEIWKGENAYYGLVNGNRDERLDYCADVSG